MQTTNPPPSVSHKWESAKSTTNYKGDLPALRSFVQSESRRDGSRFLMISSRRGLLQDPRAALCAAVWLLEDYTGNSTKYRLLEKKRQDLYRFLRDLAVEMEDQEVQFLVTRLVERAPQSKRPHSLARTDAVIRKCG